MNKLQPRRTILQLLAHYINCDLKFCTIITKYTNFYKNTDLHKQGLEVEHKIEGFTQKQSNNLIQLYNHN